MISRRHVLEGTALLAAAAACGSPRATPGPVDSPDALVDWIGAHPEQASVLVDDGRGTAYSHLVDRPRPIASAVKVTHLAAYAQAIADGRLDPAGQVTVRDWERWYLPNTDGGAHPLALGALGATPDSTVTWDDVAAAMIDFSDNAATDLLCERLGDDALRAAAQAGGWPELDVPHIAGEALWVLDVDRGPDRRSAAAELGRAFAAGDPAALELAAVYTGGPLPGLDESGSRPTLDAAWDAQVEAWDGSWSATATQIAALHRAAATDGLGPEVSGTVRRHLERAVADRLPAGVLGLGQKAGGLPGLLCYGVSLRRDDGTVGVSVLSLSRLPQQVYQEIDASGALLLGQQVLLDDALRERLGEAVAA